MSKALSVIFLVSLYIEYDIYSATSGGYSFTMGRLV